MSKHYIETPQTIAAGDKTFLTNNKSLLDLPSLSENSIAFSPSGDHDIIKAAQIGRRRKSGLDLKTPHAGGSRAALRPVTNGAKGEFTPMMKSVTKNNAIRSATGTRFGTVETPAFLKSGYKGVAETPALPRSHLDYGGEDTSSSAGAEQATPVPQVISSSAQSTPLAQLPGGNNGVVGDGNVMSLREQENIISKIEKENFGLKMKIHFLEEAMNKNGGEFNKAALKENTELKVSRVTMQRELHKFRKTVQAAEKDLEIYRLQLEDYKERTKRRTADESTRQELAELRSEVEDKEAEIKRLQSKLNTAEDDNSDRLQKLQDEVEDLEADLREKDRIIGDREEEVEALQGNAGKESHAAAELEEELDTARRQLEELQDDLKNASAESKVAREEREEALEEKRQAEEDLNELRDEMSNKSFTTKGLTRQYEEKANKLEDQLEELRQEHAKLKEDFDDKSRSEREVKQSLQELEHESTTEKQNLHDELDVAMHERDVAKHDWDSISKRMQQALDDLRNKADEKDLLQSRHDALTNESSCLQRDLGKAQSIARDLEQALDNERQHAAENDRALRIAHQAEAGLLTEQVDSLHREINEEERRHAADLEAWDAQRQMLESSREKAEEQANGLRRTVDKLQESEGTLSGKDMKLQDALESETLRHRLEEEVLNRQIKELNEVVAAKRVASDENRNELSNAKEELRISIREQASLKETVDTLEDEIEVLQANLEEEAEYAQRKFDNATAELDEQVQHVQKEKQSLQDQLANVNIELHNLRTSAAEHQAEMDELKHELKNGQTRLDDTFRVDQEKLELKRSKLKLESELARLREERRSLSETNAALEQELEGEMERASAEAQRLNTDLDQLRNKRTPSGSRDRELVTAKAKADRLEKCVKDLEAQIEQNDNALGSPSGVVDLASLRADLSAARDRESASVQREVTLKSTSRQLKAQITDLERQVHELLMSQYDTKSPSASPSSANKQEELAGLRKQLAEANATTKDLKSKNRSLEREKRKPVVEEEERKDLHAMLKSSTLEAEALALKISERDARLTNLKAHVKRVREERSLASKRAKAANHELEALQTRYEDVVDRLQNRAEQKGGRHEKEMRGLIVQIQWLRAKLNRETAFRNDLAWSKEYMVLGEQIRVACNEADLKMIREMGVKPKRSLWKMKLTPKQKWRAAANVIIASVRMRKLSSQWKETKKIRDVLEPAKQELRMCRQSAMQQN